MTHFGLISPAASSHINTITTLGWELKRRGHQVTLFGVPYARAQALASGVNFRAIGESDITKENTVQKHAQIAQLSGLAAMRYSLSLAKEDVAILLRDGPAAIREEGVEALLVDYVTYGSGSVAEFLDIPFITVYSALIETEEDGVPPVFTPWNYNPAWWAPLRNRMGYALIKSSEQPILNLVREYREKWRLPSLSGFRDSYSKLAQLSQQPAEFEFPRTELPECLHFTGPYMNPLSQEPVPFPFEKLTGKPLIYASMGTLQNRQTSVFQCVAEACAGLDVQLVISLGGGIRPESLPQLPGSPIVVGYAPQLELLKKAALVITHGGANTVLEALSYGVPLVAIPNTYDQPGVGARLIWTGTGEVVSLSRLNVPRLRTAIQRVLTEESYKKNALRLQEAIRKAGGFTRAVDIIEQAISTGKPVLSANNGYQSIAQHFAEGREQGTENRKEIFR
ncbi:glycosyltransferase [Phormidium sp. LEGE 05292]|uniref:glycosyltransferase n=1 Tax=[Phormidium] sp. LEGE 05292 TaxID=767427 RepID=UPI00187DDC29|nr:glycosyltransferase [Phormidium sp. LEGE 05292]MBE9224823.1 glycosyltransferase [Phormidium sp. LEGE 05292]